MALAVWASMRSSPATTDVNQADGDGQVSRMLVSRPHARLPLKNQEPHDELGMIKTAARNPRIKRNGFIALSYPSE